MADDPCETCEGTGKVKCEDCHGRGGRWAHRYRPTAFYEGPLEGRMEWEGCSLCDGTGRAECDDCLGTGVA